ncbi:MAG: 3-dehydroquinate synthase [Calditrichaeota bacterium]|nr:MAG: 3-dehydroquinate synthase [Calditrichota bacterium]
MQTLSLRIKESPREIPCHVGRGLWPGVCAFLREQFPLRRIFALADAQVAERFQSDIARGLAGHPGYGGLITFPAGEASKSREQKARLEDALLQRQAGRDSLIVAVGGGVTGDLAGYVAATLHRGVPLVHVPTTLLAQVDSSIGGKVGINHPLGKNLIGAFYQPAAVFCDVEFLGHLPEAEFLNGMAEVIKYAVILDDQLWGWLEEQCAAVRKRDPAVLEEMVARSIRWKIRVVEADEKEEGYRSLLNFGHTVGHAIEQLSQYRVKHGFAVAAGMRVAARLSHRLLGYPRERVARLDALLHRYALDRVNVQEYSPEALWECMIRDKKARQQAPRFTLLRAPGRPELFYPVEKQELAYVIHNLA